MKTTPRNKQKNDGNKQKGLKWECFVVVIILVVFFEFLVKSLSRSLGSSGVNLKL